MSTYAIVPVKKLSKSKTRLSTFLTSEERTLFTLAMLEDVLGALKHSKVNKTIIVGANSEVESFAKNFGMMFLREQQEGLNPALNQTTKWCIQNGAEQVLILPTDVPVITPKDIDQLIKLASKNSIVISPSKNGGTNALLQTPPEIIVPSFGNDSFNRHTEKAAAKHVKTKVYVSSRIILDIDSGKDLSILLKAGKQTGSYRFLTKSTWGKAHNLS